MLFAHVQTIKIDFLSTQEYTKYTSRNKLSSCMSRILIASSFTLITSINMHNFQALLKVFISL